MFGVSRLTNDTVHYLQAFVREENIQKNPGFILTNLR